MRKLGYICPQDCNEKILNDDQISCLHGQASPRPKNVVKHPVDRPQEATKILKGVPQDTILGPLLFLFNTYKLPFVDDFMTQL